MSVLFNRYLTIKFIDAGVVIGGRQEIYEGAILLPPTMDFRFRHTSDGNPNDGEITVHNMAPETQRRVLIEGARVEVEAGYWPANSSRETSNIFSGQIRPGSGTNFKHAGAETRIIIGDGDDAYAHARVRDVFDSGNHADIGAAITQSFKARGIEIGRIEIPSFTEPRPRTVDRLARRELDDICYQHDLQWSIQDGVLNVYPRDDALRKGRMILEPGTGVIGIPEFTDKGARIDIYMLPSLRPGDVFQYRNDKISSRITEDLKIETIEFGGNNARGRFGGTIEAKYLSENKVIRARERYIGAET